MDIIYSCEECDGFATLDQQMFSDHINTYHTPPDQSAPNILQLLLPETQHFISNGNEVH